MKLSPLLKTFIEMRAAHLGLKPFTFPEHPSILTLSSAKLDKASVAGQYVQAGINLQPANESGREMCPHSHGSDCRGLCLATAGRNVFKEAWNARQWRTAWYLSSPDTFLDAVKSELHAFQRRAKSQDLTPVFRADLLSDTSIGSKLSRDPGFTSVVFSDYSKHVRKAFNSLSNPRYHVCLSFSGVNERDCLNYLERGGSISVVFRGSLPETWNGSPVVDGDKHDFFFLAPRGAVWGLVAKGAAKKSRADNFTVEV